MGTGYLIVAVVAVLVLYLVVRIISGRRCPKCRALLGLEAGEKRAAADGSGLEWDDVCGKCGYTKLESKDGLECTRCERLTAVVERRYTGSNGIELSAVRCLACGHAWKQEYNYSGP